MDFAFSPQEEQFRREVRAFLEEAWGTEYGGRGASRDLERVAAFNKKVAERGWYSLGWPTEYGGTPGFTPIERFILSSEATRVGAPLSLYAVNIMGPLIIKYGTPWMKEELLPRIRRGDVNFVLGFTEPDTGSDLANLKTRAVRDGDGYRINGQKMYGHAEPGSIMYLAVRTDESVPARRGISVFFVEYPTAGMTATRMPTLAGSYVGATFYDDVYVPADHLLGEENRGWDYIREALDLDRTSGIPYGHIPELFRLIVAYARTTVRDGEPLSAAPWVRDRLAQLTIEVEAGELLQAMTASKIAAGLELRSESSVVKIFMTELERRLTEFAAELCGPLWQVQAGNELAPMGGAVLAAGLFNVAITIAGGSNEIQRNIIAQQGLGLPRG